VSQFDFFTGAAARWEVAVDIKGFLDVAECLLPMDVTH